MSRARAASGSESGAEGGAVLTARAVVRGLVAQGVRDVVLAPGSRSAPLAYALFAAEEAGWLRLHVRVDERSAAFLALGLTRGDDDGAPVAVVTTSGTAVANLHPAVLEASHAGRPLVVVTADRPHELRGTGANQTTEQVGIFGRAVRRSLDLPALDPRVLDLPALDPSARDPRVLDAPDDAALAAVEAQVARLVAAARGLRTGDPGPVHANIALREPLRPARPWEPGPRPAPRPAVQALPTAPEPVALPVGPRTVVVAGDGAGPGARLLAERARWPLLAEPSSGARYGPLAVGPYRLLLAEPLLTDAVERVVVLGHPTLSRPVSRLLARRDIEVVVVAPPGAEWTDVAGVAARVCGAVVPDELDETDRAGGTGGAARARGEAWLRRWLAAGRAAEEALARHLAALDAAGVVSGPAVARAVAHAPHAAALVAGASMAVRDLDLAAPVRDLDLAAPMGDDLAAPLRDDGLRVLANRGLAGIDGTVSTAAGVALATGRPVRALVGDLTFLHDVGALARGSWEREPDLQVVVANDDGGAIFATLEHGAAGEYERLFGTPQGLDVVSLCAGFGVPAVRVDDLAALRAALDRPIRGTSVVDVRVDRAGIRDRMDRLAQAAKAAIVAALRAGA